MTWVKICGITNLEDALTRWRHLLRLEENEERERTRERLADRPPADLEADVRNA